MCHECSVVDLDFFFLLKQPYFFLFFLNTKNLHTIKKKRKEHKIMTPQPYNPLIASGWEEKGG